MSKIILEKAYLALSGSVFFLVGIFHLLRLIYKWQIMVGTIEIPFLLSYAGLPGSITVTILAFWLFSRKKIGQAAQYQL